MKCILTVNNNWNEEDFNEMINNGITNFRINGIHLSNDAFDTIERIAKRSNISLFYDLPGCKSRIWTHNHARVRVNNNEKIIISDKPVCGGFYVTGNQLFSHVSEGDLLEIRRTNRECPKIHIEKIFEHEICGKVLKSGIIGAGYHIFCRKKYIENKCLQLEDFMQMERINKIQPSVVAVSFADAPDIILESREYFKNCAIYAKIESPVAIKNILDIISVADGIIIGRDDLSAFYNMQDIELITEKILKLGRSLRIPVIGASNYFQNLYDKDTMSDQENSSISKLFTEGAYGIYVNETNKDHNWKKYYEAFRLIYGETKISEGT